MAEHEMKKPTVRIPAYSLHEELMNAISHGVGALFAIGRARALRGQKRASWRPVGCGFQRGLWNHVNFDVHPFHHLSCA